MSSARAIGHPLAWHMRSALRGLSSTTTAGSEPKPRPAANEDWHRDRTGVSFWHATGLLLTGRRAARCRGGWRNALPLLDKGLAAYRGHRSRSYPADLSQYPGRRVHAGRPVREGARGAGRRPGHRGRRTTSAPRRPSCTASEASCTWPRRTTKPPPRRVSTRRSRRPAASRARRGSCAPRRASPGSGSARAARDEARGALAAVYGTLHGRFHDA